MLASKFSSKVEKPYKAFPQRKSTDSFLEEKHHSFQGNELTYKLSREESSASLFDHEPFYEVGWSTVPTLVKF